MNDVTRRALRSSLFGIVALAALLFIPAGTLDYWQGWLFMAVFVCTSGAITVYLAIRDPKLLERRMNVGPRAEKEPVQKIIMRLAMLGFIAMLVFPVLDHRFGWSAVPPRFRLPKAKRSFPQVRMRSCGIRCMPAHSSCSSAHRSPLARGGGCSQFFSYY